MKPDFYMEMEEFLCMEGWREIAALQSSTEDTLSSVNGVELIFQGLGASGNLRVWCVCQAQMKCDLKRLEIWK